LYKKLIVGHKVVEELSSHPNAIIRRPAMASKHRTSVQPSTAGEIQRADEK
jgi:muramidase (phage lysozyme)